MPRRGTFQRVTGYSGGGKDTDITEWYNQQSQKPHQYRLTPPDCRDLKHLCDSTVARVRWTAELHCDNNQTVLQFTDGN